MWMSHAGVAGAVEVSSAQFATVWQPKQWYEVPAPAVPPTPNPDPYPRYASKSELEDLRADFAVGSGSGFAGDLATQVELDAEIAARAASEASLVRTDDPRLDDAPADVMAVLLAMETI